MPEHDVERLKQTLLANGEDPSEAESLAQVARALRHWPAPSSSVAQRAALLDELLRQMPTARPWWVRLRESYVLALLLSQVRVIQTEIWLASAFLLLLGVLITLAQPLGGVLPLAAIAPIVAAAGVAMLYDEQAVLILELEDSTPSSARQLLLARLALLFGFNLALSLLGSALLALLRAELSLWPLVLAWLGPMTLLSGLAFLLSVLLRDALAASAFSLSLWFVHLLLKGAPDLPPVLEWARLSGFSVAYWQPWLIVAGLLAAAAGLWWVGAHDRLSASSFHHPSV